MDSVTTDYTLDLNSGLTQVLVDNDYTYLYGLGHIAQHKATGAEYFLVDGLGIVRHLVDANGKSALTFNLPLSALLGSIIYQVKTLPNDRVGFRIDNDTTIESGTHIGDGPSGEYSR